MDSNEFKKLRQSIGWSNSRTATELGKSERTIQRWSNAKNPPKIACRFLGNVLRTSKAG